MCFRPAESGGGMNCPNCGKKINSTQGLLPKKCPFCKTVFEDYFAEHPDERPAELDAPAPPNAPSAPSAPGAPSAPSAPGAPKPPVS